MKESGLKLTAQNRTQRWERPLFVLMGTGRTTSASATVLASNFVKGKKVSQTCIKKDKKQN
jgi:F0F1-type ATP synthase epsilon subunit